MRIEKLGEYDELPAQLETALLTLLKQGDGEKYMVLLDGVHRVLAVARQAIRSKIESQRGVDMMPKPSAMN